MRLKTLIEEDFTNYKKPCMFIGTISCGGKCCIEANIPLTVCQNDELRRTKIIDIDNEKLITRYLENDLTSSIVFGGLEPFEQYTELKIFLSCLRFGHQCEDDVVIYTGYNEEELQEQIQELRSIFCNIIIKFGRYIPNDNPRYDNILGVTLASSNQYARKIS